MWDDLAVALTEGQRLRMVSAGGGRARLQAGMTIAEARSRCAELHLLPWDEETIARDVTRATAAFVQASPQVTPVAGAPGLWWVGASGLDALGGEPALARGLLAIARQWHPAARVGIADSCVTARAATWQHSACTTAPAQVIVPPGGCAAYLATAPLGIVPMTEELRDTLRALGMRTMGDFAKVTADDVERRWGAAGLASWRLAHGIDPRRPGLTRLEHPRTVSTELHPSSDTMEPILFLVRAALDRLIAGAVSDGRAAAVVAITLALDEARGAMPNAARAAHTITREVRLPRALARVAPLFERCRALLDDWRLEAPVCGVTVAITATAPLSGAQGELLNPAWRDPAAADAAFARLRSTLGMDAIVRPVVRDTHRPEQAATWERVDDLATLAAAEPPHKASTPHEIAEPGVDPVYDAITTHPTDHSSTTTPPRAHALAPAFRQLDPPERAEVTMEGEVPRAVRWRNRWMRLQHAAGPERLAGDWWTEGYARDYWRCRTEHGADLTVYHDLHDAATGHDVWYVQGWHD